MTIKAQGVVGRVYKTQAGNEEWDLGSDEGEYEEGWEQINTVERRLVVRKRVSHSMVTWALPPKEDYVPMSHRSDGPIF